MKICGTAPLRSLHSARGLGLAPCYYPIYWKNFNHYPTPIFIWSQQEGIEPPPSLYKREILPLYYAGITPLKPFQKSSGEQILFSGASSLEGVFFSHFFICFSIVILCFKVYLLFFSRTTTLFHKSLCLLYKSIQRALF